MVIFPAIDIKDGECVRLVKGDFSTATKVADSYMDTALSFVESGAKWIHMVDLDGAKNGGKPGGKKTKSNRDIFLDVAANVPAKVQVGGGIRTLETAETYLSGGISRVIIGSAAVKDPEFVKAAIKEFGAERVAVGIDAKDGYVALNGWLESSKISFIELALRMCGDGVKYFIYTDIAKDGTLSRPNHSNTKRLQEEVGVYGGKVIASGGIKTISSIQTLKKNNIYGAICGKSLYSGTLNLKMAIRRAEA